MFLRTLSSLVFGELLLHKEWTHKGFIFKGSQIFRADHKIQGNIDV